MEISLRLILRAAFQDNIQPFCFRRPDSKMRQVFPDQLRPDRVATLDSSLRHFTPSTAAGLVVVLDFSFRVRHQELQSSASYISCLESSNVTRNGCMRSGPRARLKSSPFPDRTASPLNR